MTLSGRGGALAFALALITSLLTPARAGAQTQATQSGTATIANGGASTTATITSVITTRTFLVFSTTLNDANPANTQVRGELTNSTTLTFTRSGTAGAVSIQWSVVEYASGITVQRGTTSTLTGATNNVPIASVNTGKSFPIISYSQAGTTFAAAHFLKAKITSSTNLQVAGAAGTRVVSWQVVEFTNASVQSGDVSFITTDSSKTASLTSVNTAKSWLVYTHTSAAGTATNIGQKLVRGQITDATTLTFDRSSTGQTMNLTWYLIEFTDNTSVQAGSLAFTNAQTQQDVTITSVDTAKSFAVGGAAMQEGRSAYTTADNPGVGWMTHELTSATNLRITRALTGAATADMGWFVVTIPKAVLVTPVSGLTTTEAGGTATFTVRLDTAPTGNVTIGLSSSDTTEGTVSPASVTFTPADWNTPQTVTVTGVDDAVDDGNLSYSIVTAAATSSDTTYSGLNAADVSVTTTDNDTAAITVTPTSGLTTTEAGTTATFTMVLASQPTATVTVGLSSSDTTEGTVSPASVIFTTANWNTPQTVTVTGVDDAVDDGNVSYSIVTAAATSTDATYGGLNAANVSVTTTDNDAAGITVTPTSGLTTTEAGGTATFTVVLASQPTATVTVGLSSSDTTEGTVSPASLAFTTANWSTPRTVTVTGVNDSVDDGDLSYSIVTAAATSSDATYSGMNAADVGVTTTDNDTAAITVTPTSGLTTTEAGGTATFTVVLATQPTATVTVGLSSSDTTEGTVSPASLAFTTANWNTPRTVTVTGVNDSVDDGNVSYTIVTAAATSSDTTYSGRNAADVSVTTTDNDTAAITVTPTSGPTTTEAGGTATFTVVLATQPTATVTVGLSSSDTTEGTVSPASVAFTTANWNTPQTVTVTGVDDAVDDGNVSYSIVTAAATSSDTTYSGVNAADVVASNTDNDAAAITVTPTSGLTTTEAGGTATFTVVLATQPTATVTVGLSSSDTTEGTVSPASVIFTTANWNTPQTVTVTGVDDAVDDGNLSYSIVTAAATSTDATYGGLNAANVSVTTTDNDAAGITVTPTSGLTTTEAGGTATFTVVLASQPTATVTVGLSSSDTTEGTVSPASLAFTTANWSTPRTVTVTGVNDSVDDGNSSYSIVTAAATSSDATYSGMNAADVGVTTTDNDTAAITVTPTSGLTTTEAGGTATFTVVLATQPTATVTVGLSTSDTTEGTVSPASVTFTTANWNTPQTVTVTGVNDSVDDGNVSYTIVTAAATSSDATYTGLNAADVSVTTTDNDTAAITVTPTSGLTTTEAGGTATFTVVLATQPTADVTLPLSSSDTTEGTVSPASLTFTTATWSTPQTVTVTGVDDAVDDGNVSYTIVTAAAASSDTIYHGLNAADVSVTTTDNDAAGITVTPTTGLTTTEAGGTATFTVVLATQPTASVTVGLSSSDTTEGTVSPASVAFTTANWNTPQTVTVAGVDDVIDDGDQSYTIVTVAASSADAGYNGLNAADVSGSNVDNDAPGITVTPTSGLATTEAGATTTFTAVLALQPTGDVSFALTSSDTTEGTVAPASLTFTAANWNTPQTVTVTGVDDAADDGDQSYTIVTAAATSSDSGYNGFNAADISVSNADNDEAGITVTPTSGLTTTESGGVATFTVVLDSQPTASVTVGLSSSDTTEGTVGPASLTFTAANWSTAQTVTVSGVDDAADDGDQSYTIVTAAATSSDAAYNGLNAADVSVTTADDDAAGITVTPSSGLTTTEAGGTATFTVVLASQPTADVTVGLSSSDTTEGTVSPASLTFTASNWSTPQAVTATGVDDSLDDGGVSYTISTTAATSSDSRYDGLNPDDVSVTTTDNDVAGIAVSPTSGLVTSESGTVVGFAVVLNSQPAADVVVAVTSSNTAEGSLSTPSLTFTPVNWSTPQVVAVTGVDDPSVDRNQVYVIQTGIAVSADPAYDGVNPPDVSATNTDDDVAGVTVTPASGLTTTEGGGTAAFTIVLNSRPTADVTIPLSSSDVTEGTIAAASVTLTTADWNVPHTVTVTGVNDVVQDGAQGYTIVTGAASSADALYAGLNPDDASLSNADDDTAGITVSPTSGLTTTESGGSGTFTMVLTAEPTADVTIGLSSGDLSEGTVAPASVTFTAANWSTPQTVTVTGADDAIDDGDVSYAIVTEAATSADAAYDGQNTTDVNVITTDDDAAGVTVSPTSGLITTEAGGNATFTVILTSQPTVDVTIALTSSDPTEGTVQPASLTFSSTTWNVAQTVTVAGVDDAGVDGAVAYTIVTGPATSDDVSYSGSNPADVAVTTSDDDGSGVTVSAISGTTTEAGGTATFTVVLGAQPTAAVTIPITSSDVTEGTVSPAALTFTAANWNTPQTVTVKGVDDSLRDGDVAYSVVTGAAASADVAFNGLAVADVAVTTTDDDTAGITVLPTTGLRTSEAGSTATFTVVLDSQPTANVTVGLSSSDTSEGTVAPSSLIFTAANWSTPQTATVTGVDDAIGDGDVAYTIVTAPSTSGDSIYNGLDATDVSATTSDDDTPGIVMSPTHGLITTEAGGMSHFAVALTSQPTANVLLRLSSSQFQEGTVTPDSLIFTATSWNTPQTVTITGVDDLVPDGSRAYSIVSAPAISGDASYEGMNMARVGATNVDDDSPGITITPASGLVTSESGQTATFLALLNTRPASDVLIALRSSDASEAIVSPTVLTFTPANWNTPQPVTIFGVDDAEADGAQGYTIVTDAAASADRRYAGLDAANLVAANSDNDAPGITVTPVSGLATSEAGGDAMFVLALNTPPAADVTVALSSTGINEGVVEPAAVTFTPATWNWPQVVTVTGVDDAIADGARAYRIVTVPAQSLDPDYDGIDPEDVSLTNFDDDAAGISISASGPLTTSEFGGSATFVVTLTTRPSAEVRIPIVSSNPREGMVTPRRLVFTPDNWDNPAEVTVTGVSDGERDGGTSYSVVIGPATSADPRYNGITSANVGLTNLDDALRTNPGTSTSPGPDQAGQPAIGPEPAAKTSSGPTTSPRSRQPAPAAGGGAPPGFWMPDAGRPNMPDSPASGATPPSAPSRRDTPAPTVPDDAPTLPEPPASAHDVASPEPETTQDPSTPDDDVSPADKPHDQSGVRRLPGVQGLYPRQTTEGTPLVLGSATGGGIAVSPAAGTSDPIEITLVASHGTLSLAGTNGVQVIQGPASGSATLTVVGSADSISAALDGLTFQPPPQYTGDADIHFDISYAAPSQETAPAANSAAVPAKRDAAGPHASHAMRISITPANNAPAPSRGPDQAARPVEPRPADR